MLHIIGLYLIIGVIFGCVFAIADNQEPIPFFKSKYGQKIALGWPIVMCVGIYVVILKVFNK